MVRSQWVCLARHTGLRAGVVRLTGSRWQVIVSAPQRATSGSLLHIVSWSLLRSALCGVFMPDWRDVPVEQRPFASPGSATCRRCRGLWRQMSEAAIPAEIRRRADEADAEDCAGRRARVPSGQRSLFPLAELLSGGCNADAPAGGRRGAR